jgi:hypothetical protein
MYQMRMMRSLRQGERSATAPLSNTLNSCADNVIADQIDNLPEARMVPEREETAQSAEEMTDVVSFVLYQAGWPGKYQRLMEDAVIAGTGVCQVFWDDEAMDGEGMVSVLAWHPEDFYPDPMVEDIQDGRACFKTTNTTINWVAEHYPHASGYIGQDRYAQDAQGDQEGAADPDTRVTLIEYWYKKYDDQSRRNHVHMALLAGGALLYSTEYDMGTREKGEFAQGVFAHGQYPFTLFKYRPVWRRAFLYSANCCSLNGWKYTKSAGLMPGTLIILFRWILPS